jgi:hypothetical protein
MKRRLFLVGLSGLPLLARADGPGKLGGNTTKSLLAKALQ